MKKYLFRIIIMCIAFFLLVFFLLKIKSENRTLESREDYQVITGISALAVADMENICDSMECVKGCYTAYESQAVEGIMGNTETVTVVAESCSSDMLFSSSNVLSEDDFYGCLLDENTMYTLFGTARSVGQTVTYGDKEYIVRGIIYEDVPIMVINYPDDGQASGLIIDASDELYRGQYEDKLLSAYGISGASYYFYDYKSFVRMLQMPGKWSDFSSWGDTASDISAWYSHVLFENKDVPEQLAVRMGYRYLLYYVVALILAVCLVINGVKCILLYRNKQMENK